MNFRRKLGALSMLIEMNNGLRVSIPIVFVNIFRPQLQKLDKAFKPGLSQIQWLSKDFDAYIEHLEMVCATFSCSVNFAGNNFI